VQMCLFLGETRTVRRFVDDLLHTALRCCTAVSAKNKKGHPAQGNECFLFLSSSRCGNRLFFSLSFRLFHGREGEGERKRERKDLGECEEDQGRSMVDNLREREKGGEKGTEELNKAPEKKKEGKV
jgi:hypothetical protein